MPFAVLLTNDAERDLNELYEYIDTMPGTLNSLLVCKV